MKMGLVLGKLLSSPNKVSIAGNSWKLLDIFLTFQHKEIEKQSNEQTAQDCVFVYMYLYICF